MRGRIFCNREAGSFVRPPCPNFSPAKVGGYGYGYSYIIILEFNNCKISSIENETNQKIKFSILKQAAELQKQDLAKTKEENSEYKIPGKNF